MHDLPELGPLAKSLIQTVGIGVQLAAFFGIGGMMLGLDPYLLIGAMLALLFGLLRFCYWAEERFVLARKKAGKTTGWMAKSLLKAGIVALGVAVMAAPGLMVTDLRSVALPMAALIGCLAGIEKFSASWSWKIREDKAGEWGRYQ